MAVDDYGIEVLKKAADYVTPGNKSDYKLKSKIVNTTGESIPTSITNATGSPIPVLSTATAAVPSYIRESPASVNTISTSKTTVTTSKTLISTPEGASDFSIFHETANATVYIGNGDVDVTDFLPLHEGDILTVRGMSNDDLNELYGIVSASTVVVYVVGAVLE